MFRNREDAGRQLAEKLRDIKLQDPLVLAIPRGGLEVGAVLARELGAELDVVLARKLRAPTQPELAIGGVGEDGQVYLNHQAGRITGVTDAYLDRERQYQLEEIARRREWIRAVRPAAPMADRSVIVTDDGIATGSTMIAALQVIQGQQPHEVIVAVPVAPPERLDEMRHRCDRVVCLLSPAWFFAIGQFYETFEQVEDARVIELLRKLSEAAQPLGKELL
jgi:putative phosphoribosyl transferase